MADAREWATGVWPHVHEARAGGAFTLQEIADVLNARGVPAFKGGRWSSMQVWRLVRQGPEGAALNRGAGAPTLNPVPLAVMSHGPAVTRPCCSDGLSVTGDG